MDVRHWFYDTVYRLGRPIWDIPTPPELIVVVDVTRLAESGVTGPFDLVIDNGCYHTLSEEGDSPTCAESPTSCPLVPG